MKLWCHWLMSKLAGAKNRAPPTADAHSPHPFSLPVTCHCKIRPSSVGKWWQRWLRWRYRPPSLLRLPPHRPPLDSHCPHCACDLSLCVPSLLLCTSLPRPGPKPASNAVSSTPWQANWPELNPFPLPRFASNRIMLFAPSELSPHLESFRLRALLVFMIQMHYSSPDHLNRI